MATTHDCMESACKGIKFDGANLTCGRCLRPFYMECLTKRNEITYLISSLNANSTGTPLRFASKVKKVFHQESTIEFVCENCKKKGSFIEAAKAMKTEMEQHYNEEVIKKCKEIEKKYENEMTIMRTKYTGLELVNADLSQTINETTMKHNELEQINAQLNQKILDMENASTEQMDGVEHNEDPNAQNTQLILNQMHVMTSDIEARVKLECEKVIKSILNDNCQDLKRKKTMSMMNNAASGSGLHQNMGKIDLTGDFSRIPSKLKPPKYAEPTEKDVYQIHVAKFDCDTTENDIKEHVIETTKIDGLLFKVSKLLSKKDDFKTKYATFKITTLNNDIYRAIMDENVWQPNFQARDYTHDKFENRGARGNKINVVNNEKQQRESSLYTPKNLNESTYDFRRHTARKNVRFQPNHRNENIASQGTPSRGMNVRGTPKRNIMNGVNKTNENSQHYAHIKGLNMPTIYPLQPHNPYMYYFPQYSNGQHFLQQAHNPPQSTTLRQTNQQNQQTQ